MGQKRFFRIAAMTMQSLVLACACFCYVSGQASMYSSIAASGDLLVACEGTDLRGPDVVHVMKAGREIGTVDVPPDLDSTNFKQTQCDQIEGGLIIDSEVGAIYVATDDMYGKSSFGASLIKIDIATLKIVKRLKMPPFTGPVSAIKGTTPGAMIMTPDATLLLSDRQGRFHVVDLKTFSFTKTVILSQELCANTKADANSIALDSKSGVAFLNMCDNIYSISLKTMDIIARLKGSFIKGKLTYTDGLLLAYANVPGPGVYDPGMPQFVRIAVSKDGNMTVKDELPLQALGEGFFGDGGDGAFFVESNFAVFTGAEKAPCPDEPGAQCPHLINKLGSVEFPAHGQMHVRKIMDLSKNFTAITNIARKSTTTLVVAGYHSTPITAGIIEVPTQDFLFMKDAMHDDAILV